MTDRDSLVIGVDCGGTKTRAAVARTEGSVLGIGVAGPANPREVGAEGFAREVDRAVNLAFGDASIERQPVSGLVVGAAGVATAEEQESAAEPLRALRLVEGKTLVVSDLRIAQAGAFACGPGVVLISGTGSCAYGRDRAGRERRAGGWGGRLDDPGSATDLGLRAVVAAIRAEDGRAPETALGARVTRALGVRTLREILPIVDSPDYRSRVAPLAREVIDAADGGDAAAREIVRSAATELASLAAAVVSGLDDADAPPLPIAIVGSLGLEPTVMEPAVRRALRATLPNCPIEPAALPPVLGAVAMAIEPAGGLTPQALTELAASGLRREV